MSALKAFRILAGLALAGFGVALFQTYHFFQVRSGLTGFESFCTFGAFNCEAIELSPYAELLPGVPLSSFAAGWLLAIFILSFFLKERLWKKEATRALLLMSLIGLVFSVVYFFIMAFILETFCLMCLILDGIILALLIGAWMIKPKGLWQQGLDKQKWKTFLGVIGGSLVGIVLLGQFLSPQGGSDDQTERAVDRVLSQKPSARVQEFHQADVPIHIVKFSDFQCPHCKKGAKIVHKILQKYPGQVEFIYKNFPLSPQCNHTVKRSMHRAACEAAKVAICAKKQNRFQSVYSALFANQDELASGVPKEIAIEEGMDPQKLKKCLKASDTQLKLSQDIEAGNDLGIQATPTFFINGRKVEGAYPLPAWIEIIEKLKAKQKKGES